MYKLSFLAAVFIVVPSLVAAQLLGAKSTKMVSDTTVEPSQQTQSTNITPQTEESATVQKETPQLPPVEITPEQKIYARRKIQKNIQTSVVNANKAEREKMLDAVETLQKMKNRRENLNKSPEEQVPYKKPQINASNRQDVQKYLQETFVDTLDDSFKTPDQEQ